MRALEMSHPALSSLEFAVGSRADWLPSAVTPLFHTRSHFHWAAARQWAGTIGVLKPGHACPMRDFSNGLQWVQGTHHHHHHLPQPNCFATWGLSYPILPSFSLFIDVKPASSKWRFSLAVSALSFFKLPSPGSGLLKRLLKEQSRWTSRVVTCVTRSPLPTATTELLVLLTLHSSFDVSRAHFTYSFN